MESQLPPLAVATDALNRNVELTIAATLTTWDSGFAPPNGMVKLSGFNCVKGAAPTVTVTGMVVVSPLVWKTSWPIYSPATAPPPGSWLTVIATETAEGAVPLTGVGMSQLPPSAVLAARVQFSVPEPPFGTCTICEAAVVPLVLTEKLNCPGRSAKNAPDEATVRVTGTTIAMPGLAYWVMMISP